MKRLSIWHRIHLFGNLSLLFACFLGPASAHADCRLKDDAPQDLSLPSTTLFVSPDMPVGTTIGTVRVAAVHDIAFTCSGVSNAREAKLADIFAPAPGFRRVFLTNVTGVGLRITASGGNFAGIDDMSRPVPYRIRLPPEADRLTGFRLRVDFVKTGPIQDGVLAAGKLMSVLAGTTDLVDVKTPTNAIVFSSFQCDVVRASGMITTGIGTGGAFSQDTLIVRSGCNPDVSVMIQSTQPYVYRHWSSLTLPLFRECHTWEL